MSASLSRSSLIFNDREISGRVKAGVFEAANIVLGEPKSTNDYRLRRRFALKLLEEGSDQAVLLFLTQIADNATISATATNAEITDEMIRFVISSYWTGIADAILLG